MAMDYSDLAGSGNANFMPMDSWRVMKIMAEFVDSFEKSHSVPLYNNVLQRIIAPARS